MKQPDGSTSSQEKMLHDFDEKISKSVETRLQITAEQDASLAKIIRRSTETGSLVKLARILKHHGIDIPKRNLRNFRDYLIINRMDMKDLEPQARERLREYFLRGDGKANMSDDYRQSVCSGSVPKCRGCRWFVTAPDDSDTNSELSCVEMGTKGADDACVGYLLPPS